MINENQQKKSFLLRDLHFSHKKTLFLHKLIKILSLNGQKNKSYLTALVDKGKNNKWQTEQLGKDPATVS